MNAHPHRSTRALQGASCILAFALAFAGIGGGSRAAAQEQTPQELQARAAAAREAGHLEQSLELYRRAVALRPEWDEGQWYIATLLYELDRHAEARDAFIEVLRMQPAHAGALGMKGLCEFQLGRYDQALADLMQSRELGVLRSPGIATVVRYHAGILLTRYGDFELGNQVLSEFAVLGAESPQVLEAFGLNVLRMPMLPAQLPADARQKVMLAGRAGYALAGRHIEEARKALDELIARYPGTPHAHYARGVLFLTEAPDRALEEFRRELAISPSHVPARLQMAFEYLKRGEPDAARTPAEEAVQLAPEHFATRLALGQVRLETGDVPGAVAELERAALLAPGSPQPHFLLARAYTRAGRPADAERARAEFTRLEQRSRAARQGDAAVGGIPSADAPVDRRP